MQNINLPENNFDFIATPEKLYISFYYGMLPIVRKMIASFFYAPNPRHRAFVAFEISYFVCFFRLLPMHILIIFYYDIIHNTFKNETLRAFSI